MRILLAHNYYQQSGGEDQVFAAESRLLERYGHSVVRWTRQNSDIADMSRLRVARNTLWNPDTYRDLKQRIRREKIDVAHFHNTFPLISPSAYYAARSENVPVIQSLHNYRLMCPGALFYREGRVCESCMNRAVPWPGVVHSCYRKSRLQSSGVAGMLTFHRAIRTWSRAVDTYIALSDFSRDKFVEGGFPRERIAIKTNFLDTDPGKGKRDKGHNKTALYVGRLTEDKGLHVLLAAWRELKQPIPLTIAGGGPLSDFIREQTQTMQNVTFLGEVPHAGIVDLMKKAGVLIVPSVWYEFLPLTIVEAYATGLPVIASNLGSLATLIRHGVTGLHFPAGDHRALARTVERMLGPESDVGHDIGTMGDNARAAFLADHSAEGNYKALMAIYQRAVARANSQGSMR